MGHREFVCVDFENNCIKTNKEKLILSQQECMPGTLVSGNKVFAGVLWRGRTKRVWVIDNGDFSVFFGVYIFGSFRNKV